MTLGGWIFFGIMAFCIAAIAIGIAVYNENRTSTIAAAITSVLLILALLIGMRAYYHRTESGKRALKTWHSEIHEGIDRQVRVYDVEGELIAEYEGKFDIDYDDDRIIFDDQDGKRHVIYYPTGTVIVDEK